MNDQDGAVDQQQMTPEQLKAMLQQPVQRNLTIGGLSLLLAALNDLEVVAMQAEIQVVVNSWLRAKGLMV